MAKRNLQRYASTLFEWLYLRPTIKFSSYERYLPIIVGLGSSDYSVPLECGALYTRLVAARQNEPFIIFTGKSRVSVASFGVSQAHFYASGLRAHCAVPEERVKLETSADGHLDTVKKVLELAHSLGVASNCKPSLIVVARPYKARHTALLWGKHVNETPLLVISPVATFESETQKMELLGELFYQVMAHEVLTLSRLSANQQILPITIPKAVMAAAELLR